jgi:hypothetical protein
MARKQREHPAASHRPVLPHVQACSMFDWELGPPPSGYPTPQRVKHQPHSISALVTPPPRRTSPPSAANQRW